MEEILSIIIFVSALYKSEKMAAASVVRDDGYCAFEVWQKMHACGTVCGILSGCEWRRAVKNNNKKKICVNIFKVIHQYFLHYFCAANMKVLYAHYIYKLLFIHVIHASVHVSEKNCLVFVHTFFFCLFYACVGIGFVDWIEKGTDFQSGKSFEMRICLWWSLIVLRWPSGTDGTLESRY